MDKSRFAFRRGRRGGYTLIEVVLVAGLIVVLSALTIPRLAQWIRREELLASGNRFRSLLTVARAHAAFDNLRFRIRFPEEGETDALGGTHQPIIEREIDPIHDADEFVPVTEPWAVEATLLGKVRCAEVRLGRPSIEQLQEIRQSRNELEKKFEKEFEEYNPERWPLMIEPDGTSDWAVFVFTEAPEEVDLEALENHVRIELILEGTTGSTWIQRPFYDEELDLFEERGWPAVLRQDFTDKRMLTERDVLELRDVKVKPTKTEEAAPKESG